MKGGGKGKTRGKEMKNGQVREGDGLTQRRGRRPGQSWRDEGEIDRKGEVGVPLPRSSPTPTLRPANPKRRGLWHPGRHLPSGQGGSSGHGAERR